MLLENLTPNGVNKLIERSNKRKEAKQALLKKEYFMPPVPPASVAPKDIQVAMDSALTGTGIYDLCSEYAFSSPFTAGFMGYAQLATWEENWLLRAMVEPIVKGMTKKWLKLRSRAGSTGEYDNQQTISAIEDQFKLFKIKDHFKWAAGRAWYAGGCKLFIDNGEREEDLKTPLIRDGKKLQGQLKGFIRIEAHSCYPGPYNAHDPLAEDYFNPEYWYLNGKQVHRSRFIHFVSTNVPYFLKPKYNFYGIPMIQFAHDAIKDFMEVNGEASQIIKRLNLDVLKTGLSNLLKEGCEASQAIQDLNLRVELFETYRDNSTALVIDKETEDFATVTLPLTGLDVIVAQKLELLALVPRLPVMKLFGTPPKGFNATGESDENIFSDRIAEEQEEILTAPATEIIELLQLHVNGEVDEDIEFDWPPVKELSEREQAEINQIKAGTHKINYESNFVEGTEVRTEYINDPNSGYNFLKDNESPASPGTFNTESIRERLEAFNGRPD